MDEDDLSSVVDILRAVSASRISSLHHQVQFFWRTYFSSLRAITLTTLQIINDRVFPYTALKYEDWNDPPSSVRSFSVCLRVCVCVCVCACVCVYVCVSVC